MQKNIWHFILVIHIALVPVAVAECPNACSGNGVCGAFAVCTCFRNWMANDCSESELRTSSNIII
jgi:hypothetical protein